MRTSLIAAVSALALLAGPALAQTTSPGGAGTRPSTTPPAAAPAPKPMPDPLMQEDVSQIKGSAVYGSDDKKIGSVSTVLMKPDSKQIDRFVVTAGGVLGVGGRDVALPSDDFKWDASKGGFKISQTEDQLKSMPEWKAAGSETSTGSSAPPSTTAPSSIPKQ
ncbi:MAG TPA: PRC-barrel domain-containing protein [Stellaceae bacterium]|nr:PRC-barrel domain-containing protein [Stellaceae bacterium]